MKIRINRALTTTELEKYAKKFKIRYFKGVFVRDDFYSFIKKKKMLNLNVV